MLVSLMDHVTTTTPGCYQYFWWVGGTSTNNRAEIIAPLGLLFISIWLNINELHVYGDSKCCIDWIKGHNFFQTPC